MRAHRMKRRGRARLAAGAASALILLGPTGAKAGFLDDLMAPFRSTPQSTAATPQAVPPDEEDEPFCPPVVVFEGGAALRAYAGGGEAGEANALRHQISIANLARECANAPGGGLIVKVGVEGRALIGPVGGSGTFNAPLSILVKRGETIVARRSRNVAVTIPAGTAQGSFAVVEEGIAVPPGRGELSIEAGLGNVGAEKPQRRQRR